MQLWQWVEETLTELILTPRSISWRYLRIVLISPFAKPMLSILANIVTPLPEPSDTAITLACMSSITSSTLLLMPFCMDIKPPR